MFIFRDWTSFFDTHTFSYLVGVARVVRLKTLHAAKILLVFRMLHIAKHFYHCCVFHFVRHNDALQHFLFNYFSHSYAVCARLVLIRAMVLRKFFPSFTLRVFPPATPKRNSRSSFCFSSKRFLSSASPFFE